MKASLTTYTGGIHASVSWEPKQLAADTESTININFSDAFSGEALTANVLYDFAILNSNGIQIYQKQNLTATSTGQYTEAKEHRTIYKRAVVEALLLSMK